MKIKKLPKKYQPAGFEILYEDRDVIVGNKSAGYLTVAALWEKENTIHNILNTYIRKGSLHSKKCVYVVHRLDQATSGVLIFAKTPEAQRFLKSNWKTTEKKYFTLVRGILSEKSGMISSYLSEDEDYVVHSTTSSTDGQLAQTEFRVVKETAEHSLLKINLLTGKKNQIRVHMADHGHPIVGDTKYGKEPVLTQKKLAKQRQLMLHSYSLTFTHPFSGQRIQVQAQVPDYFRRQIDYDFKS